MVPEVTVSVPVVKTPLVVSVYVLAVIPIPTDVSSVSTELKDVRVLVAVVTGSTEPPSLVQGAIGAVASQL